MAESSSQAPSTDSSASSPGHKRTFRFWRIFWLTFLVVSLAYAWYSFYVPANNIAWAENYAAARQQAAGSGKPMVLYFTGEWCAPCRIMKRQVWADEEVKTLVNAQFVAVAIDVDSPADAEVLDRYNVTGAPVTIVTDPQGHALRWRVGGMRKAEFLELLKEPDSAANKDS